MRIVIITQEEPFYLPPALNRFCIKRNKDIVGLIILSAFNEKLFNTARRLFDFYAPFDFARLLIRFVAAKAVDRLNKIRVLTRPYSAKDAAQRQGIPIYQPENINSERFIDIIRYKLKPDLLVSMAASQVIKQRILDIPPLGCINLHSALLPRYQGMMPNFWTMFHNETQAAVTIHYMVEKLDAGDIILQKPVPIYSIDSLHDLMVRSKEIGVQALLEAVDLIESKKVVTTKMDMSTASYFSFPKRDDAKSLREQGRRLL